MVKDYNIGDLGKLQRILEDGIDDARKSESLLEETRVRLHTILFPIVQWAFWRSFPSLYCAAPLTTIGDDRDTITMTFPICDSTLIPQSRSTDRSTWIVFSAIHKGLKMPSLFLEWLLSLNDFSTKIALLDDISDILPHVSNILGMIDLCKQYKNDKNIDGMTEIFDQIVTWTNKTLHQVLVEAFTVVMNIVNIDKSHLIHDLGNVLMASRVSIQNKEYQDLSFYDVEYVLHFFQSYYAAQVSIWFVSEEQISDFVAKAKNQYDINNLISTVTKILKSHEGVDVTIKYDIPENTLFYGYQWVMCVDLKNVIQNASYRGKADSLHIYLESDDENTYLCIADNGIGIDETKFSDLNDIFQVWKSGSWSSGIGLKPSQELGIEMFASNDGMESRHQWVDKWALIKIKVQVVG